MLLFNDIFMEGSVSEKSMDILGHLMTENSSRSFVERKIKFDDFEGLEEVEYKIEGEIYGGLQVYQMDESFLLTNYNGDKGDILMRDELPGKVKDLKEEEIEEALNRYMIEENIEEASIEMVGEIATKHLERPETDYWAGNTSVNLVLKNSDGEEIISGKPNSLYEWI